MRKHDVRKWIHAVLDMLPLFIIPIFAIYMRNENSTRDVSVDYPVNKVVDFNQNIVNGNFTSLDGWNVINYPSTYTLLDNEVLILTADNYNFCDIGRSLNCSEGKYVVKFKAKSNYNSSVQVRIPANTIVWNPEITTDFTQYHNLINITSSIDSFELLFVGSDNTYQVYLKDIQLFNLTQMFGSGNEPSLQEFEDMFPNEYYDYTTNKKVLVQYGTETYFNTDVGSQMMYSLYTPVKEYFNLNNVANFGSIYDWLQLNFFNGTAPMSVFIVWNIILYEFIMDVLFLIYAVFMFIIDFVECLIDKAFGKSYRGGR